MSEKEDQDYVVPVCSHDDGSFHGVRYTNGELSQCVMTPAEEGRPMHGNAELVMLDSAPEVGRSARVKVGFKMGGDGPAQVATKQYRDGWDGIFGKRASSAAN